MSQIKKQLQNIVGRIDSILVPDPIEVMPSHCVNRSFKWPGWGNESGIYSFEKGDRVLYIGRALGASLKQRLKSHCASKDNAAWVEAMESPETRVYVFPFPRDEWYWTAAVEAKLNADIRTVFGMRIS